MSEETSSGEEEFDLEEEAPEEQDRLYEERRKKRLTEEQKAELREKAELGLKRIIDLADEYGVTRQYLHKWFKQEGIKWGSRKHELEKAAGNGIKAAAERYAEQRQTWIEETRVTLYKDLKQTALLAKKVIADTIKASRPLSTADDDLKAIHRYHRILQQNAEARLSLLEADNVVNQDDLPKLVIDDLTNEQLQKFHEENGVSDPDELDEILRNFEKDTA